MHKSFRHFLPLAGVDFGVRIKRFVPIGAGLIMESLFVYGTLQDPQVQTRVFGRIVTGVVDALDGYRKAEISIGGSRYPIAQLDSASSIDGRILDLTPEELVAIDHYEGSEYRRLCVVLRSGVEAWVYCE